MYDPCLPLYPRRQCHPTFAFVTTLRTMATRRKSWRLDNLKEWMVSLYTTSTFIGNSLIRRDELVSLIVMLYVLRRDEHGHASFKRFDIILDAINQDQDQDQDGDQYPISVSTSTSSQHDYLVSYYSLTYQYFRHARLASEAG